MVTDVGDGHERAVRAERAAHRDIELRLLGRAAVAAETSLARAREERRDVRLRIEADDAVLETIGEVDSAIRGDGDIVHAVVDRRREVESLGRVREFRRLARAVPFHA